MKKYLFVLISVLGSMTSLDSHARRESNYLCTMLSAGNIIDVYIVSSQRMPSLRAEGYSCTLVGPQQ